MAGEIDETQVALSGVNGLLCSQDVLGGTESIIGGLKVNFTATAAPTGAASFAAGYSVGSLWWWADDQRLWICYGDALWQEIANVSSFAASAITDGELPILHGGTAADNAADARANLEAVGKPASATDTAIARWGDTLGAGLEDTSILVEDASPSGHGLSFPTCSVGTPAVGRARLHCRTEAGRDMMSIKNSEGWAAPIQRQLSDHIGVWAADGGGATTETRLGLPPVTFVGTATARSCLNLSTMERMQRVGRTAAAAALASARFTNAIVYLNGDLGGLGLGGFYAEWVFGISDATSLATNARMFLGMSTSVAAPTSVEPSALTNCFGLAQLSTDSTQWYFCYGGSAAQTPIPTGISIGRNQIYRFCLYSPSNAADKTVYFYIEKDLLTANSFTSSASVSSGGVILPGNAVALNPWWSFRTSATVAVGIDWSRFYLERVCLI